MLDQAHIHQIIVADEIGMASLFPTLKHKLTAEEVEFVSLVYCIQSTHYHFQPEIEILQKHFPHRLVVFFQSSTCSHKHYPLREVLEAIINSNTSVVVEALLSATPELRFEAETELHFLGIQNISFQEQYFLNQ